MKLEEQQEILRKFYNELFYGQEELDPEYVRIINENFWDLVGDNDKK